MTISKGIYFRAPSRLSLSEKLDFYSTPEPNSGCQLWLSTTNLYGYGRIYTGGRAQLAHRVSWAQRNGPVPEGMEVCHRCDVPLCINPDHLFLGTHVDNMGDMSAKGRTRGGIARGADQRDAKLTDASAMEVFLAHGSQRVIASRFGINQKTVWQIKAKLRWSHIHS